MTEPTTPQRPVRKLTVENFSVIKHAELEFGKITVLIGPQASGKSLLCKLAYFLSKELIDLAVREVGGHTKKSWEQFASSASAQFVQRFSTGGSKSLKHASCSFEYGKYRVSLDIQEAQNSPVLEFSQEFQNTYETLYLANRNGTSWNAGTYFPSGIGLVSQMEEAWFGLNTISSEEELRTYLYIPAGRAFFGNPERNSIILQDRAVDPILREFAGQVLWDTTWKIGMLTTGRGCTDEIAREITRISKGFVLLDGGFPRFIAENGEKIPLELLSTGTLEMLPLFNVIERLMYSCEHNYEHSKANGSKRVSFPFIFLEEPEANIFPSTQKDLVRLFSWLVNDEVLDFNCVITTHSPYILSAFDNLIKAGMVGRIGDEKRQAVNKLIDEKYWIAPEEFRAYKIVDGNLEAIYNQETGELDADYLDSVSGQIAEEYSNLLEIQYGH